ncbi:hypothetical protein PSPO01_10034 [Paraphaeosphaeria sporulosa]
MIAGNMLNNAAKVDNWTALTVGNSRVTATRVRPPVSSFRTESKARMDVTVAATSIAKLNNKDASRNTRTVPWQLHESSLVVSATYKAFTRSGFGSHEVLRIETAES